MKLRNWQLLKNCAFCDNLIKIKWNDLFKNLLSAI